MVNCKVPLLTAAVMWLCFTKIRTQRSCPLIQESELGTTDTTSTNRLISDAYQAVAGDSSDPPRVQLFNYTIVCLQASNMRNAYSSTSVVASYTCMGSQDVCDGTMLLSQFDFGCTDGDMGPEWSPSVSGSAANIITTPADGNLSTPLRSDCGTCISPARNGFELISNNPQHCAPCVDCDQEGSMMCTDRLACCNFYNDNQCIEQCPEPMTPDSNFNCILDCGDLMNPANGEVDLNGTTADSVATYSCDVGFRLNGTSTRTCQMSAEWSESAPTCDLVDCGALTDPDNGQVILSNGASLNSEASYSCNIGFAINGTSTRICQINDQWSGSEPTCEILDCGDLMNPANGEVDLNGTTADSVATYSCDVGFRLNGTSNRTCQMSAEWSESAPTCDLVDCGALTDPDNGQVILSNGASLNSEASYSCNIGFAINGTSTRICQINDQWSGSEPTCEILDCGDLMNPANGEVDLNGTTADSVATYSCDVGFRLNGTSNRTCQMSAEWSESAPTCDLVDCGALTDPDNGQVILSNGASLNSEASYSCNIGFAINGTSTRICQINDQWSGSEPTCEILGCGPLGNPNNGSVDVTNTTAGSLAFYRCVGGFLVGGNDTRVCQEDDSWSGSEPVCNPINCGNLTDPANGTVSVPSSNFTSVATYSCDLGFNLIGQRARTCMQNRIWSGMPPQCEVVNCSRLPDPENGQVNHTEGTLYSAVATYYCNRGYELNETIERTCLANGSWSDPIRPILCEPLPFPTTASTGGPTPSPLGVDVAWIAAGICFFLFAILFVIFIVSFGIYKNKTDLI